MFSLFCTCFNQCLIWSCNCRILSLLDPSKTPPPFVWLLKYTRKIFNQNEYFNIVRQLLKFVNVNSLTLLSFGSEVNSLFTHPNQLFLFAMKIYGIIQTEFFTQHFCSWSTFLLLILKKKGGKQRVKFRDLKYKSHCSY